MKTLKIKTFGMRSDHNTNHFFILSKGYNAGKPLEKPCPNCFIVTADNEEHKYKLFWICYSLWKSGAYLPLLRGSVIPFLPVRDASAQVEQAMQVVSGRLHQFENEVRQLQQLIKTERLLVKQVNLITEIKAALARKLLKAG